MASRMGLWAKFSFGAYAPSCWMLATDLSPSAQLQQRTLYYKSLSLSPSCTFS